jgi:PAS domain-containing protein
MLLYSFSRAKKQRWQDEYRFKCADNTYKYVLNRGSTKDENGKAVRMIRLSKISLNERRRAEIKIIRNCNCSNKRINNYYKADFGNQTSENCICKSAYTSITGFEPDEVLGKTPDYFKVKKQTLV